MRRFAIAAILLAALAACSSSLTDSGSTRAPDGATTDPAGSGPAEPLSRNYAPEAIDGLPPVTYSAYGQLMMSINSSGQIAATNDGRAYRLTNDRLERLPALNGDSTASTAVQINDEGWVVGWSMPARFGFPAATLWRPGQPPFAPFSVDQTRPNYATGINASGVVIGYHVNDAAFLWTRALLWSPNARGGAVQTAADRIAGCGSTYESSDYYAAINASGTIVGYCNDRGGPHVAMILEASVSSALPVPAGSEGSPVAVSDSGLVVGTVTSLDGTRRDTHAVVWRREGGSYVMHTLQTVGDINTSTVTGVNNRGGIVGSVGEYAVYWTSPDAAPRVLEPLAGETSASVYAINASAVIVGVSGYKFVRWRP